jgi:hypothetical protein
MAQYGVASFAGAVPASFLQSMSQPAADPQGTLTVGGSTGSTGGIYAYGTSGPGSGPQAPLVVVGYQKIVLNGTTYWIPLLQ